MEVLKIVLIVILILVCVAITTIILFQEGKQNGLSSLSGQQFDSYYSKNKGRTKEGLLVKFTTLLVVLFFVLSAVLNIGSF
ncbi:MAG: preprotein translocase subunit SecG [Pseudobutyrivibrio sp.]|nr:preprotein translocase subunit SecG [Pseudobutyrivibrio sp.]